MFYAKSIDLTILVTLVPITAAQTIETTDKAQCDVLYFSESQAKSRAGVFYYMGATNEDNNRPNGQIMFILTIMRNIMPLAAEAECGALLLNSKELDACRTTLIDMGQPQQATEIITDNSTADGIMRGNIKLKQTKSMDVQFYLVCD